MEYYSASGLKAGYQNRFSVFKRDDIDKPKLETGWVMEQAITIFTQSILQNNNFKLIAMHTIYGHPLIECSLNDGKMFILLEVIFDNERFQGVAEHSFEDIDFDKYLEGVTKKAVDSHGIPLIAFLPMFSVRPRPEEMLDNEKIHIHFSEKTKIYYLEPIITVSITKGEKSDERQY